MEDLYGELWGNVLPIEEFSIRIPDPQFYLEPGYRVRLQRAETNAFPLTGVSSSMTEKVFRKLQTMSTLPCGLRHLLICEEYAHVETLLLRLESETWSGLDAGVNYPRPSSKLDFQVSGQPGSGKTAFLSYILARRLASRLPTVYRFDDDTCYLFDERTSGREVDAKTLFKLDEKEKRKLWILTDESLTNPNWTRSFSWFVVLAASPVKVKASRQWQKDRNVGVYYMNTWGWYEIVAAFSLHNPELSQRQIENLYTTFVCFGPVARTCLAFSQMNNESYDEDLDEYLGEVDREIHLFVSQSYKSMDSIVFEGTSYKIVLMKPCKNGRSYEARIITRWIAQRIAGVADIESRRTGHQLFKVLLAQPTFRSSAGWFFETYANDWFNRGGAFEAEQIPIRDGSPFLLRFQTHALGCEGIKYFTTPASLADQVRVEDDRGVSTNVLGKYFQPYAKNQESFDGLVINEVDTLILLQITIAMRHEIKPHGIQSLLAALPATIKNVCIVFVVPGDRARSYANCQSVPDARALGLAGEVKQFKLIFTDHDIQSLATGPLGGDQARDTGDVVMTD